LYLRHAPGGGTGQTAVPAWHDDEQSYTCVMSYAANNGDYCGKCLASMRGMKQSTTAAVAIASTALPPSDTAVPVQPKPRVKPFGGLEDTHRIIPTMPDGNCLFRAVAQVAYGKQDGHDRLRRDAIAHMKSNVSDYIDKRLAEEAPSAVKFSDRDTYLNEMEKAADEAGQIQRWGGLQEQRALSAILKRPIHLYTPLPEFDPSDPGTPYTYLTINGDDTVTPPQHAEPIEIYYNGENHYWALGPLAGDGGNDRVDAALASSM
jgi:hypothetical protein